MAKLPTIGVLGGMGPEATVLLQKKLLAAVDAQDDAGHIPLLIDMNPQVPSRIAHLIEGTGDNPGPVLAKMAHRLEAAGAEALAMPCNTAHHYASDITRATRLPFLNMIERSCDFAAAQIGAGGHVGILASPAVRMTGLFDEALSQRGLHALWPNDQTAMLNAIRTIKAVGPCGSARSTLAAASAELLAAGARLQFIACTEFSLIEDSAAPGAEVVDTLDILVGAIKEFSVSSPAQEAT